jgi:hypothetical protein
MDETRKKFLATQSLERFGVVVFKKGNDYMFDEITRDGRIYYRTTTSTGEVEIYERDLKRFFEGRI